MLKGASAVTRLWAGSRKWVFFSVLVTTRLWWCPHPLHRAPVEEEDSDDAWMQPGQGGVQRLYSIDGARVA
jgi:hypothetical protein